MVGEGWRREAGARASFHGWQSTQKQNTFTPSPIATSIRVCSTETSQVHPNFSEKSSLAISGAVRQSAGGKQRSVAVRTRNSRKSRVTVEFASFCAMQCSIWSTSFCWSVTPISACSRIRKQLCSSCSSSGQQYPRTSRWMLASSVLQHRSVRLLRRRSPSCTLLATLVRKRTAQTATRSLRRMRAVRLVRVGRGKARRVSCSSFSKRSSRARSGAARPAMAYRAQSSLKSYLGRAGVRQCSWWSAFSMRRRCSWRWWLPYSYRRTSSINYKVRLPQPPQQNYIHERALPRRTPQLPPRGTLQPRQAASALHLRVPRRGGDHLHRQGNHQRRHRSQPHQGQNAAARKDSYEEMLRRKLQQQIEKEREQLTQKLGYIETSLHSLESPEHLKRRSPSPPVPHPEPWRKDFRQEMERLEQRKREAQQRQKEREAEAEVLRAQLMEEERAKRKAELAGAVRAIQQRGEERAEQVRSEQEKLKDILGKKQLFHKLEEHFQAKEQDLLEERKRKLAEIRQLKQPLSLQQLQEHEQKVDAAHREKQALRSRELRMNSSRARAYKPSYESAFYRQAAAPPDPDQQELPKHKLEKMRQFSEQVKAKYAPEVDEDKRRQMEEQVERESRVRAEREERERELLEKPKLKGLEYLELVKKLPKKSPSPPSAPHSDRPQYKNYLGSVSLDLGRPKPWKTILGRSEHKAETALLLQYESEKVEERLRRKEEYTRVMKKPDDGAIDQDYYDMVKAKLDLLAKD